MKKLEIAQMDSPHYECHACHETSQWVVETPCCHSLACFSCMNGVILCPMSECRVEIPSKFRSTMEETIYMKVANDSIDAATWLRKRYLLDENQKEDVDGIQESSEKLVGEDASSESQMKNDIKVPHIHKSEVLKEISKHVKTGLSLAQALSDNVLFAQGLELDVWCYLTENYGSNMTEKLSCIERIVTPFLPDTVGAGIGFDGSDSVAEIRGGQRRRNPKKRRKHEEEHENLDSQESNDIMCTSDSVALEMLEKSFFMSRSICESVGGKDDGITNLCQSLQESSLIGMSFLYLLKGDFDGLASSTSGLIYLGTSGYSYAKSLLKLLNRILRVIWVKACTLNKSNQSGYQAAATSCSLAWLNVYTDSKKSNTKALGKFELAQMVSMLFLTSRALLSQADLMDHNALHKISELMTSNDDGHDLFGSLNSSDIRATAAMSQLEILHIILDNHTESDFGSNSLLKFLCRSLLDLISLRVVCSRLKISDRLDILASIRLILKDELENSGTNALLRCRVDSIQERLTSCDVCGVKLRSSTTGWGVECGLCEMRRYCDRFCMDEDRHSNSHSLTCPIGECSHWHWDWDWAVSNGFAPPATPVHQASNGSSMGPWIVSALVLVMTLSQAFQYVPFLFGAANDNN